MDGMEDGTAAATVSSWSLLSSCGWRESVGEEETLDSCDGRVMTVEYTTGMCWVSPGGVVAFPVFCYNIFLVFLV